METEAQDLKNLISVPCEACGGQMAYSAKKQLMECPNCSHTQAVPTASDRIVERSFSEALDMTAAATGLGVETKQFNCKNCGAITNVESTTVAFECGFCGSNNVNEEAHKKQVITPAGILPFKVEKNKAVETFKEWIGSGWFHPNALTKVKSLSKIEGVYVPFWTYDAETDSSWTAEAGYYYEVTVEDQDANGNTITRQERRVRWEPAAGYYAHAFDDVLVVGSGGISQSMIERIYPYPLNNVVNYEPKFMLGWRSEVYKKDVKQGYEVADKIMDNFIEGECAKMIPGDTYRNLNVHTHKHNITFKHILLPVWIAAYQFDNKTFQVIVNGQTGKIAGDKPTSWFKIAMLVIAIIIVVATLYFVFKK